MGPYCKFCDSRCFVHPSVVAEKLPSELLLKVRTTSGDVYMLATCPNGKAFDKKQLGVNVDDFWKGEGAKP